MPPQNKGKKGLIYDKCTLNKGTTLASLEQSTSSKIIIKPMTEEVESTKNVAKYKFSHQTTS